MKEIGKTKSYPYPRLKSMEEIMKFIRNPTWQPDIINIDLLKLLGIASSKELELINALIFLEIIDKTGRPTQKFQNIKSDYQKEFSIIVYETYAELFKIIPPNLMDQERVVNFFMKSSGMSRDTAEYQGNFFVWCCREAGIEIPQIPGGFKRARFKKEKMGKSVNN